MANGRNQDRSEAASKQGRIDTWGDDIPAVVLLVPTLLIVVVFTWARFKLAGVLDLRTDEAYYWTWSKESALSFLDHPPMVAYFVRFGTAIFGDTPFGARFANLLALPLTELLLADIARRRTGDLRAAILVVLLMESTVYFAAIFTLVEPGVPAILFIALMFWALCRLDETNNSLWWVVVGLAGGLALLSKYTALLFVPAVLAFVIWPKSNRRWLADPWFWTAGVLALMVFSPVLWWNSQHAWASFLFQGARAANARPLDLINLADYLGNNLGLVGPVLMPTALVGALFAGWRAHQRRDSVAMALVVGFAVPFAYFALRSLSLKINTSWSIIMWPFGITALVIGLAWHDHRVNPVAVSRLRRATFLSVLVGLPIVALLFFHGLFGSAVWFGRQDPIGADAGYDALAKDVLDVARSEGATWIATTDYRTYAALRWASGRPAAGYPDQPTQPLSGFPHA